MLTCSYLFDIPPPSGPPLSSFTNNYNETDSGLIQELLLATTVVCQFLYHFTYIFQSFGVCMLTKCHFLCTFYSSISSLFGGVERGRHSVKYCVILTWLGQYRPDLSEIGYHFVVRYKSSKEQSMFLIFTCLGGKICGAGVVDNVQQ